MITAPKLNIGSPSRQHSHSNVVQFNGIDNPIQATHYDPSHLRHDDLFSRRGNIKATSALKINAVRFGSNGHPFAAGSELFTVIHELKKAAPDLPLLEALGIMGGGIFGYLHAAEVNARLERIEEALHKVQEGLAELQDAGINQGLLMLQQSLSHAKKGDKRSAHRDFGLAKNAFAHAASAGSSLMVKAIAYDNLANCLEMEGLDKDAKKARDKAFELLKSYAKQCHELFIKHDPGLIKGMAGFLLVVTGWPLIFIEASREEKGKPPGPYGKALEYCADSQKEEALKNAREVALASLKAYAELHGYKYDESEIIPPSPPKGDSDSADPDYYSDIGGFILS